jgi:hypothetical protein
MRIWAAGLPAVLLALVAQTLRLDDLKHEAVPKSIKCAATQQMVVKFSATASWVSISDFRLRHRSVGEEWLPRRKRHCRDSHGMDSELGSASRDRFVTDIDGIPKGSQPVAYHDPSLRRAGHGEDIIPGRR